MIEYVRGSEGLLAMVIRRSFDSLGVNFVTDQESTLQVGVSVYESGRQIEPHYHKEIRRDISKTQEVLHIESGEVEVFIFEDDALIDKRILFEGDTLVLLAGGHGFNILKSSKIIEVKQGPYIGREQDKRFL